MKTHRVFTASALLMLSAMLPACTGAEAARSAGNALRRSSLLINPLAEVGIAARSAPGAMTLAEFRQSNNLTELTASEANFIRTTIVEQNKTIDALMTYGE